jgi:hypothetical protein
MGKYDLFLTRAGPTSLVDPTQGASVEGKEGVRRDGPTFDEILAGVLPSGTVQIPEDVQRKLAEHGIELTPRDLDRIGRGIDQLVDEGGRESLLVSERVAYQVDVPARNITQAFVRKELEQTVFTNVDSVVLLDE